MVQFDKVTLKQIRILRGMSQKTVAERLGVTKRTVSNWENGRCLCSMKTFKKLCELYGVSMDDIFLNEK